MLSKIFKNKGTNLHKRKSLWATLKNAYINKKEDYAIKNHWKEHFKNPVFMPGNIYELGYEFN
jgi:hypothetical protein